MAPLFPLKTVTHGLSRYDGGVPVHGGSVDMAGFAPVFRVLSAHFH